MRGGVAEVCPSRRELWSELLAARSLMRIWRPRTPYGCLPSPRGLPVEVNRQDTQPANQIAGSPESEVLDPTGQLDVGESGEQVPKGNLSLKAGKRRSEAKVNTVAESDVVRTRSGHVELVRIREVGRIAVGGPNHNGHCGVGRNGDLSYRHRLQSKSPGCHLNRPVVAE